VVGWCCCDCCCCWCCSCCCWCCCRCCVLLVCDVWGVVGGVCDGGCVFVRCVCVWLMWLCVGSCCRDCCTPHCGRCLSIAHGVSCLSEVGGPGLKATQAYPMGFGAAVLASVGATADTSTCKTHRHLRHHLQTQKHHNLYMHLSMGIAHACQQNLQTHMHHNLYMPLSMEITRCMATHYANTHATQLVNAIRHAHGSTTCKHKCK